MQYAGLVVSVIGIIGSAFATKPWHLIVTAGIFYPLGGGELAKGLLQTFLSLSGS